MVPFDVVKLLFETVTPLSRRMDRGVTVSNEFNQFLMNSINGRLRAVSFFS